MCCAGRLQDLLLQCLQGGKVIVFVTALQALEQGLGLGFVVVVHPVGVQAHGQLAVELLHLGLRMVLDCAGGWWFGVLCLGVARKAVLRLLGLRAAGFATGLRIKLLQVLALGVHALAQQAADAGVLRVVKGVQGAVHLGNIGLQRQGMRFEQAGMPGCSPLARVVQRH